MVGCTEPGASRRRVGAATLEHLLKEEALRLAEGGEWFFCGDPNCDVVYFAADGRTLPRSALKVPVGLKQGSSPRTVCYCFGYVFEDVERDAARGECSVAQAVEDGCRQGLARCEETNPHGKCCLGDVRAAFKAAVARSTGRHRSADAAGTAAGCCGTSQGEVP